MANLSKGSVLKCDPLGCSFGDEVGEGFGFWKVLAEIESEMAINQVKHKQKYHLYCGIISEISSLAISFNFCEFSHGFREH